MLSYALLLFLIAAIGGLILAAHVLRNRFAPWAISFLHVLFAATGLVLLLFIVVQEHAPQSVMIGFGLLLLAALGGFFLGSFHLRKKLPPKAVVLLHAGLALAGFLTLLAAWL